jgi:hypothetical protein
MSDAARLADRTHPELASQLDQISPRLVSRSRRGRAALQSNPVVSAYDDALRQGGGQLLPVIELESMRLWLQLSESTLRTGVLGPSK